MFVSLLHITLIRSLAIFSVKINLSRYRPWVAQRFLEI